MPLQNTRWLTLTNILLGVFVIGCLLLIALEVFCDVVSKLKRQHRYEAELDHDMDEMFSAHGAERRGILHRICACLARFRSARKHWFSGQWRHHGQGN